jgi:hypothetical protein
MHGREDGLKPKIALRRGVGVIAALLALLALPSAILTISFVVGGIGLLPVSWPVLGIVSGWLMVVLCVGLALVVERVAAKVMFVLAAVLYTARMMSDSLNLVQFIAVASLARPVGGLVQLVDIGWLWPLSLLLLAVGIVLGFRDHRWLGGLAVGALAFELASHVVSIATRGAGVNLLYGQLLIAGRELVYVTVLAGVAYVLLAPGRAVVGTVEQAHRADAVS